MIVVAIIGILAAIAIPAYQDYIARSQVAAGLAEISPGKTQFEVLMNEGTASSTASQIGLAVSTRCTTLTVAGAAGTTGTGSIQSTLACTPAINTKTITLSRASTGAWSCATTAASKYAPKGCSGT